MYSVKEIPCYDTNRIVGIQLDDHNGNLYYIVGAYLPSDGNVDTYTQELCKFILLL